MNKDLKLKHNMWTVLYNSHREYITQEMYDISDCIDSNGTLDIISPNKGPIHFSKLL